MPYSRWTPCTVKKTLRKIVKGGNHYLVKVKGNQPRLKAAAQETVINSNPIAFHKEEQIARGRLEIRETYLYKRQNNLDEGWESIRLIVYVRRDCLRENRQHKTDSLYVCDLQTNDAKLIAEAIRSHWYIENKLHYTKDVIMREDTASTKDKVAAANLAIFRNIAFNILKTKNKSIKYATEMFANYNLNEIYNILIRT